MDIGHTAFNMRAVYRLASRLTVFAAAFIAMVALALFANTGQAHADFQSGSIMYKPLSDGTVQVTGFREGSHDSAITVPAQVEHQGAKHDVSSIRHGAFSMDGAVVKVTIEAPIKSVPGLCFYRCTALKEVVLPDSVESIGTAAFYGCSSLATVKLGSGLAEVGNRAFYDCTSLAGVALPASVVSLGEESFANCTALKSATVPQGVAALSDGVFKGCESLASVALSKGLNTIGASTFEGCSSLGSIVIPESVRAIGKNAFNGAGLEKVNLPSGLTEMGEAAFANCASLADIGTIPDGLTNIGNYAFSNCGFSSMALPDTLTYVSEGMFSACRRLASVSLPDSVMRIGASAFESCSALEYLRVPASVSTVGERAFAGLDGAKVVYFENGDADWTGSSVFGDAGEYQGKGLVIVGNAGSANAACKSEALLVGASFKTLDETGSYLVEHDGNGDDGSIVMSDVALPKGMAYAVPLCAFTKGSADFASWTASDGKRYLPGQAMPAGSAGTVKVKATWSSWGDAGCTVTLAPGTGALGASVSMAVKRGSSVKLPACPFAPKSGYAFNGWAPSSGGSVVAAGSEVALKEDETFTAQWVDEHTVTFDANGGSAAPSAMKTNGEGKLESWPIATRSGYVLEGWSLKDDGAQRVTLGRVYEGDATLLAMWAPLSETRVGGYLVVFDANGGTLPEGLDSAITSASGKLSSLPTPTRAGYAFEGWFRPDMSTQVTTDTVFTDNDKVYAKWKELPKASDDASGAGGSGDGSSGDLTPGVISTGDADRVLEPVPGAGSGDTLDAGGDSGDSGDGATVESIAMHRLYNPYSGEHFYTGDEEERDLVVEAGWTYEGIGWMAPATSATPVYRVYNSYAGEHHYTMDVFERDSLVVLGWTDEGIGWYSDDAQTTPLLREYNPYMFSCNHNYTTDREEHDGLVALGWIDEGIAWYGA